jgi:hypothetical protein
VHGGRQEVALLAAPRGRRPRQELAPVEQGGVAHPSFGQGGAHVEEIRIDGRGEPVGLRVQHPDPDRRAQPVHLRPHRDRLARVAVQRGGQLVGGAAFGVQGEQASSSA